MPSATFYNLPEEKRERLLRAAREEFSRVPYESASVNRIIRSAGIPRGSFYMYFTDKEELFGHLMDSYGALLERRMGELLEQREGDLFAAFLDLFDHIQAHWGDGKYREMADILRCNRQMQPGVLLNREGPEASLGSPGGTGWTCPDWICARRPTFPYLPLAGLRRSRYTGSGRGLKRSAARGPSDACIWHPSAGRGLQGGPPRRSIAKKRRNHYGSNPS